MKTFSLSQVLQEISQYLPDEERNRVLNDIKKLSKEVQRLAVNNYRRRSLPLLDGTRNRFSFKVSANSVSVSVSVLLRDLIKLGACNPGLKRK